MEKFRTFQHKGLAIMEVPLTEEEIKKCLELGKKRTEIDEEQLGWKYRHHGMKSELAHAIGFMGETAFEKWLISKDLKKDRDYVRGKLFVKSHEEIEPDFTIWNRDVGAKSAKHKTLDEATKFDEFLYPAKKHPNESKRVLGYPEYLVQTVVNIENMKCWLCGYVDKDTIMSSPIKYIVGKPAHAIPIEKYMSVGELLKILRPH